MPDLFWLIFFFLLHSCQGGAVCHVKVYPYAKAAGVPTRITFYPGDHCKLLPTKYNAKYNAPPDPFVVKTVDGYMEGNNVLCFWETKTCFGRVLCVTKQARKNNRKTIWYDGLDGHGFPMRAVSVEPAGNYPRADFTKDHAYIYHDGNFIRHKMVKLWAGCSKLHQFNDVVSALVISPQLSKKCICFSTHHSCKGLTKCYKPGARISMLESTLNDAFSSFHLTDDCSYQIHNYYPVVLFHGAVQPYLSGTRFCADVPDGPYFKAQVSPVVSYFKCVCFHEDKGCNGLVKCVKTVATSFEPHKHQMHPLGIFGSTISSISLRHDESDCKYKFYDPYTKVVTIYTGAGYTGASEVVHYSRQDKCVNLKQLNDQAMSARVHRLGSPFKCLCFHEDYNCKGKVHCWSSWNSPGNFEHDRQAKMISSVSLKDSESSCSRATHDPYGSPVVLFWNGPHVVTTGRNQCTNLETNWNDKAKDVVIKHLSYDHDCVCLHDHYNCGGRFRCWLPNQTLRFSPGGFGYEMISSISLQRGKSCVYELVDPSADSLSIGKSWKILNIKSSRQMNLFRFPSGAGSYMLRTFCRGKLPSFVGGTIQRGAKIFSTDTLTTLGQIAITPASEACKNCVRIGTTKQDGSIESSFWFVKNGIIHLSDTGSSIFRIHFNAEWSAMTLELVDQSSDSIQFVSVHPYKSEVEIIDQISECSLFRSGTGEPVMDEIIGDMKAVMGVDKSFDNVFEYINDNAKVKIMLDIADKFCGMDHNRPSQTAVKSFCLLQTLHEIRDVFAKPQSLLYSISDLTPIINKDIKEKLKKLGIESKFAKLREDIHDATVSIKEDIIYLTNINMELNEKMVSMFDSITSNQMSILNMMESTFQLRINLRNTILNTDLATARTRVARGISRSHSFQTDASNAIGELNDCVKSIVTAGFATAAAKLAFALTNFFASFFKMLNPTTADPAGFSSSTESLANAITGMVNMGVLRKLLNDLSGKLKGSLEKLSASGALLEKLLKAAEEIGTTKVDINVKSYKQFLATYKQFSMRVSTNEVKVIFTDFGSVVNAICTIAGTPGVLDCAKFPGRLETVSSNVVSSLGQGYEAVEYMVNIAKSQIGLKATNKLKKELTAAFGKENSKMKNDLEKKKAEWGRDNEASKQNRAIFWRRWGELARYFSQKFEMDDLLHRSSIVEMVELACRSFLYRTGNKPIGLCTSYLNRAKVPQEKNLWDLVAYDPNVVDDIHIITAYLPTLPDKELGGTFVDINSLKHGLPSYVQIPMDFRWLKKYGWINDEEKYQKHVYFIENMKIYLPPAYNDREHMISMKYEFDTVVPFGPSGGNENFRIDRLYGSFEYIENGKSNCDNNKYHTCYSELPKICSVNFRNRIAEKYLPTIYTRFAVTSKNIPETNEIAVTPMLLKVELKLRYTSSNGGKDNEVVGIHPHKRNRSMEKNREPMCCKRGYYLTSWGKFDKKCKMCPPNSVSKFGGLYCAMYKTLVSKRPKIPFSPVDDTECAVSAGNKRNGISAFRDESCDKGGLGCHKVSNRINCRFCRTKITKHSKHLKPCH